MSEARFPPSCAACHPLVSCTNAGNHRFLSPCHCTAHKHLAWQDRSSVLCCPFRSLAVCHSPGHPACLLGCRIRVLGTQLIPGPCELSHSTMSSSSCSALNFHFSFTKIKNQAHNQAESCQNLRWEVLLRTEARWTVFQRLIAFSECISIYFFPTTGIFRC